jgi:hypothetical protein
VPGTPWTVQEIADAAGVTHDAFRKWLSGARLPRHTIRIEAALFGDSKVYDRERLELREALEAAHRSSSRRATRTGFSSRLDLKEVLADVLVPAQSSEAGFAKRLLFLGYFRSLYDAWNRKPFQIVYIDGFARPPQDYLGG